MKTRYWMGAAGALLFTLGLATATPAAAQRFGLGVGYTRISGQLGAFQSNEGLTLRLGAEFNPGSRFRFGLEAGMDRLNESQRFAQDTCFLPGGGTGTCHFESRERDTGWSLSAILRAGPRRGTVRPFALLGLGFLQTRTHSRAVVTDANGNHLPNFEYDGTSSDGALPAHLGGGCVIRPASSPIGITVEGRGTALLHNYSGGPQINWSPSLTLGFRVGS